MTRRDPLGEVESGGIVRPLFSKSKQIFVMSEAGLQKIMTPLDEFHDWNTLAMLLFEKGDRGRRN